jgi:hypothetical protein
MSDETDLEDLAAADMQDTAPEPTAAKPASPAQKPSKSKSKSTKAKGDSGKKGKGKGGKGKSSAGMSVATHPRAHAQVRRAKGWGGLGGFAIAAYLSYQAGVPPEQIGLRALAAGAVGYLVAWGVAVTVWRYLVLAELRAYYEERKKEAPAGIPLTAGGPKDDESPA